jgi:hypothetical protein
MIFFSEVKSVLAKDWLWVACMWFAFNTFLEAYMWVKDSSHVKHIDKIDEDVKKEFIASLPVHQKALFGSGKAKGDH